jgi:hypothetical protein
MTLGSGSRRQGFAPWPTPNVVKVARLVRRMIESLLIAFPLVGNGADSDRYDFSRPSATCHRRHDMRCSDTLLIAHSR